MDPTDFHTTIVHVTAQAFLLRQFFNNQLGFATTIATHIDNLLCRSGTHPGAVCQVSSVRQK